jgi:spore photoproduct lyase
MKFNKILVEKDVLDLPQTEQILRNLKRTKEDVHLIDQVDKIFGRVRKPYLEKRNNLQLFIGKKRGQLIKRAPNAYGTIGEPHYYYIHTFNCPYECQYCYLQGHFASPDIVFFVNHDEIGEKIKTETEAELKRNPHLKIWFHGGEFSDSLILSHITEELPFYFDLFSKLPSAILELRTKSVNIQALLKESPLPNIITSFSLSTAQAVKDFDLLTPPLKTRIQIIKKLQTLNYPVAIHFDPIILTPNVIEDYQELFDELNKAIDLSKVSYFSLGVVRFTKKVYQQVKIHYPDSDLISPASYLQKGHDNIVRYPRPIRRNILKEIFQLLVSKNVPPEKIYWCMEEEN